MRYRGGVLRVFAGPAGGRDSDAKDLLLEASIGPPLHGEILLEQVCDLCGIAVQGRNIDLTEEKFRELSEHKNLLDFSGRTTTWIRELWLTDHTVERLIADCREEWPDLKLVRTEWKKLRERPWLEPRFVRARSTAECDRYIILAIGAHPRRLRDLLSKERYTRQRLREAFRHIVGFQVDRNERKADPKPETVSTAKQSTGRLTATFETDSQQDRAFVEALIKRVNSRFGNCFEVVDVATGATVETRTLSRWYSTDMAEWCKAAPDRFLFTGREIDRTGRVVKPERMLGYRPADS